MALVLRKAVLPRNVALLKCIKGRQVATTAHKKNPAPLSKAVLCRSLKQERMAWSMGWAKISSAKKLSPVGGRRRSTKIERIRPCISCPTLVSEARPKIRVAVRHFSLPRSPRHAPLLASVGLLRCPTLTAISTRAYSKPCSCGCPCPFPCGPCGCPGGCSCLPPPCNTPAKCIQYMTGYYYYPYGTWFCGPYHVSGTCTPIGPCGPGGPCGPCCAGPGPCGPCPKCCGPCCVCPAMMSPMGVMGTPMTSSMPSHMTSPVPPVPTGTREEPIRSGVVPGNQIKCPLSQDNTRQSAKTGISKFFPFNNTPGGPTTPAGDPKRNLPSATVLSCFSCPYSTQAKPCEHLNNVGDPAQVDLSIASDTVANSAFTVNKSFADTAMQTRHHEDPQFNSPMHMRSYSCPPLEKPRTIKTQEQRDSPRFKPSAFDYATIPNYRNPYPLPHTVKNV